MSDSAEQSNNKPWLFQKGKSGNPSGRPKGSISLKTYAKEMLASMNEEERLEFMDSLPKELIWKMAEGNPQTNTDLTTGGDKINVIVDPKSIAIAQKYEEELKKGL